MIAVLDASAAIDFLVPGPGMAATRDAVAPFDLVAPAIVDLEVLSALARLERAGALKPPQAEAAAAVWAASSVERLDLTPLAPRAWAMRASIRLADAFYVAAAQTLRCPLITRDARLARAPLSGVAVTLVHA